MSYTVAYIALPRWVFLFFTVEETELLFDMPKLGPIKRKEMIKYLRQLGFEGPFSGGSHDFLKRGALKVWVPNPHHGEGIGRNFLKRILRQAEISESEWEKL